MLETNYISRARWGIQFFLLLSLILSSFFLAGTTSSSSGVRNLYAMQMWYTTATNATTLQPGAPRTGFTANVHEPLVPTSTSTSTRKLSTTIKVGGITVPALTPSTMPLARREEAVPSRPLIVHKRGAVSTPVQTHNPPASNHSKPGHYGTYRIGKEVPRHPDNESAEESHNGVHSKRRQIHDVYSNDENQDTELNEFILKRSGVANHINRPGITVTPDLTVLLSFYGLCISLSNASHTCTSLRFTNATALAEKLFASTGSTDILINPITDPLSLIAVALALQRTLSPAAAILSMITLGAALFASGATHLLPHIRLVSNIALGCSLTGTLFAAHAAAVLSTGASAAAAVLSAADPTAAGVTIATEAGSRCIALGVAASTTAGLATIAMFVLDRAISNIENSGKDAEVASKITDSSYPGSTAESARTFHRPLSWGTGLRDKRRTKLELEGYIIPPGGTPKDAFPNPGICVRSLPGTMMSGGNKGRTNSRTGKYGGDNRGSELDRKSADAWSMRMNGGTPWNIV